MYLITLILFSIDAVTSVQVFNITENQIPNYLFNANDIFSNGKDENRISLRDVELITDHAGSNVLNKLEINRRTGDIVVKSTFDREEICPSKVTDDCTLDYVLSDKSILKEFKLIIMDQNDNSPIFKEKTREINIREGKNDKTEYLLPRAIDADTSAFGIVKYTVKFYDDDKSSEYFNEYYKLISSRNSENIVIPVLNIITMLDREKVERFSFTLIAWDKDDKSGDCRISINVLDVNDNSPLWNKEPRVVEIKECSQTKEVMKLEAHDIDDGNTENGRITFEIGEKTRTNNKISNLFHISGNILYVDLLKLQEIEIYDFDIEVIAKDGGGRFSGREINVKIIDCNKNKPQIDINYRNPKISENEKKSFKLANVIVSDPDRGSNGEFDCTVDDLHQFSLKRMITKTLKHGKWSFYTLNTIAGVEFDREKLSTITILVTCTDKGYPALSNSQVITVHISDLNDNKPEFTSSVYTFSVEENVHIGVVIGSVVALDSDNNENGRVSYDLDYGSKGIFSINNKGQIQTTKELDREKVSSYEFKVMARDNGLVPLNSSCIVKVFVLDVNDCTPEVEKQFIFEITENKGFIQNHINLGKIDAKDADLGLNGTVNFRISTLNGKEFGKKLLQITSDGLLSIYGNVDREDMKTIHFEIIVFDNGTPSLSTITTVIINVLDVNDNKPKFIFPNYPNNNFINVSLQSSVGSVLTVIEATDPDNGNNGSVFYKILGGEHINSFFDLHQSGQLILIKLLVEKRLNPDRLIIQAFDGGDPPLTETTTLYLRYYNNKNNSPVNVLPEKKSDNAARNDKDHQKDSANVTLLYGLAAVLFIVFFASLIALFFIYLKGRTNITQESTGDKILRNRKNYAPKHNEFKGHDELLDPNLCEMATDGSAKDNYTNLMFIKDPNYNLLYPRIISKSDLESNNDNNNLQNYYPYTHHPDVSRGSNSNSMQMMVNNLSPQVNKTLPMLHQSTNLLTYKDSNESLNDSNYNSSGPNVRANVLGTKEDNILAVPSSGYMPSYITSTFV